MALLILLMSTEKTQRLVLSIIDFLEGAIADGTVKADDKEGLEVAVQCIGEAFGVDPSNANQKERLSIKPAHLQSIFDVYLKTSARATQSRPEESTQSSRSVSSDESKAQAEKHKQTGNQHMSAKSYDKAIESYSQAIGLDGNSPVFFSNRAAAYSSKGEQHLAIADAEQAISLDPTFGKAYHRLGYAHFALGQYEHAKSAFERGLELEPSNQAMKTALENAKTQIGPDSPPIPASRTPPMTSTGAGASMPNLEEMMRGMGGGGGPGTGGGGGGGMPDLAGMMNNPMMRQMAESMMANGGMERLMQNPAVANMMNRVNSGGGMPSMSELMSDPALREAAQSLMSGMGRGGGASG